jgi:uncharacterized protein
MQYNVAQLLKEPTGAVRRYTLAEEIGDLDSDLNVLGPLVGELTLMRTNSGVLASGELSTAVQVSCSRCLAPIATQVRFELEEIFHPTTEVTTGRALRPDEYDDGEDALEDEALLINDKHILDVREVVRQNIWLAIPMVQGCPWEGEGECPNLARMESPADVRLLRPGEEALEQDDVDSRWAALLALQAGDDDRTEAGARD